MGFTPNIGNRNLVGSLPGEVLGVLPDTNPILTDGPKPTETSWTGPSGQIDMAEPPPPWESGDQRYDSGDARKFVTVPQNWVLRWLNERVIQMDSWRNWEPVLASDPRVKVLVGSMVMPDGNIRRGGSHGDILCWMYRSWVESRRKERDKVTKERTDAAVAKQESLKEDFKRGKYGPYIKLDEARHPSHTMAEGSSMKDN